MFNEQKFKNMKNYSLILFLILSISLNAQVNETNKTMLWSTLGVSTKLNDNLKLSYYQLHSINLKGGGINFIQPDLGLAYKLNNKWSLEFHYSPTFSIDNNPNNQSLYHRISGKVKVKTKISKRFRMSNALVAEQHFTQRSKFQQRYYYRLDLFYRDTKLPWKLRPFINQKLYVYSNGKPLQYFNADGSLAENKSPNGLHAYRIQTGVKLYPTDKLIFALYYLKQKEFNAGSNNINVLNPNTNNISRSFYDFSVLGLSLSFKL